MISVAVSLSREHCVEKILSYVKDNYVSDPSLIIPLDRSLLEEGILDSYAIVELITYLETEFELRIPDEDITKTNMGSIFKMADYVVLHKSGA